MTKLIDTNMNQLAVDPRETDCEAQIYVRNDRDYDSIRAVALQIQIDGNSTTVWITKEGCSQLIKSLLEEMLK